MNKETFKALRKGDILLNKISKEKATIIFAESDWQTGGTWRVDLDNGQNAKIDDNLATIEQIKF